ncbi:MAG: septum formation initiator family protein [Calditrichia bacterium]
MSLKPIKTKTSPKRKTYTVTVYYKYLPLWILLLAFSLVIFAFLPATNPFSICIRYTGNAMNWWCKSNSWRRKTNGFSRKWRLQKDIDHIEKVAREKYNLKRDGETIYKVVPEEKP